MPQCSTPTDDGRCTNEATVAVKMNKLSLAVYACPEHRDWLQHNYEQGIARAKEMTGSDPGTVTWEEPLK
jgi:hypothetical protein